MLKSKVGYSINPDYYEMGIETAKESTKDFSNVRLNFLYTSEKLSSYVSLHHLVSVFSSILKKEQSSPLEEMAIAY